MFFFSSFLTAQERRGEEKGSTLCYNPPQDVHKRKKASLYSYIILLSFFFSFFFFSFLLLFIFFQVSFSHLFSHSLSFFLSQPEIFATSDQPPPPIGGKSQFKTLFAVWITLNTHLSLYFTYCYRSRTHWEDDNSKSNEERRKEEREEYT